MTESLDKAFGLALTYADHCLRTEDHIQPSIFAIPEERDGVFMASIKVKSANEMVRAKAIMEMVCIVSGAVECVTMVRSWMVAGSPQEIEEYKCHHDALHKTEVIFFMCETQDEICFHIAKVVRYDNQKYFRLVNMEMPDGMPGNAGGQFGQGVLPPEKAPAHVVAVCKNVLEQHGVILEKC